MLSDFASRIFYELGPWLWILAGFALIAIEIFSGKGLALSLGLAATLPGSWAILGQSGMVPDLTTESQFGVFLLLFLTLMALIGRRTEKKQT